MLAGILFLDLTLFLAMRNKVEFQTRSILVLLAILIPAMWRLVLFQNYEDSSVFVSGEITWWAIAAAIGLPLAIFLPKIDWFKKLFEGIAERCIVFLYIYLPISFISLIFVFARNIY